MNREAFQQSVAEGTAPPGGLSMPLQAMWWDAKGDWAKAHDLCQEAGSKEGDWIHAYLHRKEGDLSNAGYWYARSGQPRCEDSLEKEWKTIAEALLA